jgi:MFS family permease
MASQAEAVSGDRPSGPVNGRVPRGGQGLALATLCTLLFLTFLDNTVVSVALGYIHVDLKANVTDLQWVVGAYALTFASIMLACGMIGDELGRKKVMLAGAGVFCAGSVLCALAPNVQTLIAGRAVMGLGAAASEPGTLSMLRHLYPDERARSRAIGVRAATSGFALAAYQWSSAACWLGVELAGHLLVQPGFGLAVDRSGDHPAGEAPTHGEARRHIAGTLSPARARAGALCSRSSTPSRPGLGSPVVIILLS